MEGKRDGTTSPLVRRHVEKAAADGTADGASPETHDKFEKSITITFNARDDWAIRVN